MGEGKVAVAGGGLRPGNGVVDVDIGVIGGLADETEEVAQHLARLVA
jgi:hypothetical protein